MTVFGTALSLSSCGGGGGSSNAAFGKNNITLRQFKNGSRIIYLQAGSGFVVRLDPTLEETSSEIWGYAYPAQLGLDVNPGNTFKAVFQGLSLLEDDQTPIKGELKVMVGYQGYEYSEETGFTSFLGFPSSINPQLSLSAPLEITLDMDKGTWKTHIPDGSVVSYSPSTSHYVFGETGGSSNSTTTLFEQERSGFFVIISL